MTPMNRSYLSRISVTGQLQVSTLQNINIIDSDSIGQQFWDVKLTTNYILVNKITPNVVQNSKQCVGKYNLC